MSGKPIVIPHRVPQRMLFCAHRHIPGLNNDGNAHLEIIGVFPEERRFEVLDRILMGRFWYFVYEVQTEYLLNLIRIRQTRMVPDDRLIVRNIAPELDAILRTPELIPVKELRSIRIESMFDALHAQASKSVARN